MILASARRDFSPPLRLRHLLEDIFSAEEKLCEI